MSPVPWVDRAELEQGERIEYSYMNCSIYFSRKARRLEVLYGECTGE